MCGGSHRALHDGAGWWFYCLDHVTQDEFAFRFTNRHDFCDLDTKMLVRTLRRSEIAYRADVDELMTVDLATLDGKRYWIAKSLHLFINHHVWATPLQERRYLYRFRKTVRNGLPKGYLSEDESQELTKIANDLMTAYHL